ncbi:MAG: UDP-N-acetylmuramoyl-tripeptide--D-alanyl-D-alanine ligase [Phycisphaerae bacterium]|nr:UDP-N-acetylmuramoyl-tripeptide--D-alanyl-D-alanine ligase [Phycisphaerae bacterium]
MIALRMDEIVKAVGGRMLEPCESFGVAGLSTDTRTLKPGEMFVALAGENFDGHDFVAESFRKGARVALVSNPAASGARLSAPHHGPLIVVNDTRTALGRLAAYYRKLLPAKVIAVTGSNGKTTTKEMIDHVLGTHLPGRGAVHSFNNDIGVPLTLLSAEPADRYLVVEIGSSAPGEVAHLADMVSPDIGVVTSIGHAHLEGFGSIDGVACEKLSLLDHVSPGGLGLVNLDDLQRVKHGPLPGDLRIITYGTDSQADIRVTGVQPGLDGVSFWINDCNEVRLPVPGVHNARNAAAAFGVARRMQLEPGQIVEALGAVRLPNMRLNVRRFGGLTLIEDCYNANPTSMAAAIEVLQTVERGRRVLVAGEMRELGTHSHALHEQIGILAGRSGIEFVVSVGHKAKPIIAGARSVNPAVTTCVWETTGQACAELPPMLAPGDTVLIKGSRAMGLERLSQQIMATVRS